MINTDDVEVHIQQLLEPALIASIEQLNSMHGDDAVYAVVVYCASGCASMGLAFNTQVWLEKKLAELEGQDTQNYMQLHASQWQGLNFAYDAFSEINEKLDDIFEDLYEADLSDDQLSELFVRVVTRAIRSVDFCKRVKTTFSGDLLLGMQFGDPSPRDWQAALEVSRQVNSADWHAKLESL